MNISEEMLMNGRRDVLEKFGLKIESDKEGTARSELELQDRHWNLYHMPYGGVQFNMADITAGAAFLTAGGYGVTASGNVDFLRPPAKDTKKLYCSAEVRKMGRRVSFVDAEVSDDAGTQLATYSFVFVNTEA